jgi:hypothetical protein
MVFSVLGWMFGCWDGCLGVGMDVWMVVNVFGWLFGWFLVCWDGCLDCC